MKKILFLLMVSMTMLYSCKKASSNSDELGGDTNIPLNVVGNTFSPTVYVNGNYENITSDIKITQSVNGINTIKIMADLSQSSSLSSFNNLIPSSMKDSLGRVNLTANFKMTSEGMQDWANNDKKAFIAVKYDGSVGDQYVMKKSNGTTITRTITQKSTTDDFSYGFYLIKTITVEQNTFIPGIKKYVAKFNHKFGLVYVEVQAEDGSVASSIIFPQNY